MACDTELHFTMDRAVATSTAVVQHEEVKIPKRSAHAARPSLVAEEEKEGEEREAEAEAEEEEEEEVEEEEDDDAGGYASSGADAVSAVTFDTYTARGPPSRCSRYMTCTSLFSGMT